MKHILAAIALAAMTAASSAQQILVLNPSNQVVTGITNGASVTFTNPLALNDAFRGNGEGLLGYDDDGNVIRAMDGVQTSMRESIGLGYLGTNAATTISNLFGSNSLPSGAAVAGAAYVADGSGGSSFEARRTWLARQTTNSQIVTNGTTASTLVISNVPAGLFWVNGQMHSTATASRNWVLLTPNQVYGARNILGWFDTGGSASFFNASTNIQSNADPATGTRNIAIAGPLLFTNTATVSFNVTVSGATNTAQVLSNSFLFLRKLD